VRLGENFLPILRSSLYTSLTLIHLAQTYVSLRLIRLVYTGTRFCSFNFITKYLLNDNMASIL
jgi:hypothetical protein